MQNQSNGSYILDQMKIALIQPRQSVRNILNMNFPIGAVLQAALVVIIADVLLSQLDLMTSPDLEIPEQFKAITRPVSMTLYLVGNLIFLLLSVVVLGRFSQSPAAWPQILTAVVWLLFLLTAAKAVVTLINLGLPGFTGMLTLPLFFLQLYLLVMFTAELHGFKNYGAVTMGLIGVAFLLALFITPILAILGVLPLELTNV